MEVHYIKPYGLGVYPLKFSPKNQHKPHIYGIGTSNQSVPEVGRLPARTSCRCRILKAAQCQRHRGSGFFGECPGQNMILGI